MFAKQSQLKFTAGEIAIVTGCVSQNFAHADTHAFIVYQSSLVVSQEISRKSLIVSQNL